MVRAIVTGGAGFIGSHVCEALAARGDRVVAFDDFNPFYDPKIKRGAAAALRAAGVEIVEGDVRDGAALKAAFERARPDVAIHLAAMAGVRPSIENPVLYSDVNVSGTARVLEAAEKSGAKRVVFASSSSVYGNNPKTPFSEDDRVDDPISPYAATKKSGELLCHAFHALTKIPVACLRFFTVYGPRQRPDLAIHKFARLMRAGEPIPFFGDGSTRRDYTFVADVVQGVLAAADRVEGYRIYNLGESRTISLAEMVAALETALGKRAALKRLPEQPGDVKVTYADVSRARKELGYDPKTPFSEGLRRFVAWLDAGEGAAS
jgi:UDP-glucuronate 4-epimerase